ncbi:hypothetical protein GCM10023074_47160 [Microbispora amethystogenes]|uniref:Uncharacterized protein n=1 Tax=Microbispora amethystogenes TaxID=1427754 RepID=A0ABQ4FF31_9ACTN|nr:hypothetical protein Mam01_35690 [Microbispora amethystogenes]
MVGCSGFRRHWYRPRRGDRRGAARWGPGASTTIQWDAIDYGAPSGSYVADYGMGHTGGRSGLGRYADSRSTNQQRKIVAAG